MSIMRKIGLKLFFVVFLILIIPEMLSAKTVAFIGVQNLSKNPEYDYLAAFTEGVILFDLSSVKEITLIERNRLEKIVSEQQLQLSGLTGEDQEKKSIKAGKLLSADYLVSVDYTLVGGEAAFTLRMADTTTGAVRVFTSRGTIENDIHTLSESLARTLTGNNYSFVNKSEKRSLLTLRDLMPGSISLYCNLVNAEITLNGKFAAYTIGNLYTPLSIPDIDPGIYTMKIHLSEDFGVVKLPGFTFSDWEEKVTVNSGRVTTLKAVIQHFNEILYKQAQLFDGDYNLTDKDPKIELNKSISFIDRQGKTIAMKISINGTRNAKGTTAACTLNYEGKDHILQVTKDTPEKKEDVGKVSIKLELNTSGPDLDRISVSIMRTDIHQGMHRE
jgi:hypothetical protein